jgi:hypothetical protein
VPKSAKKGHRRSIYPGCPAGRVGKETGTVSSVIRQRQEPLTVSQSGLQIIASEVNTWLHVTFCQILAFLKRGIKKAQKVSNGIKK